MTTAEVVQLLGALVAFLVILNELLKQVREWRAGSPELRLLREQIDFTNNALHQSIEKIASRVSAIARKVGAA